jgi:hypothetical protein
MSTGPPSRKGPREKPLMDRRVVPDAKGLLGLEVLPGQVIRMALVEAEMLASRNPSASLETFVERLRLPRVAAGMREERNLRQQNPDNRANPGATESTREEFDETERNWIGKVPVGLGLPDE